jgi:hypothetical protein
MKKLFLSTTAVCFIAAGISAAWVYNGYLVNQTVTANQNFTLNLNTTPNASGITHISAQAVYSTAAVPTSTFNDGTASTGTITISTPLNLIGVKSTATVTVVSNVLNNLTDININGTKIYNGQSWFVGNTSSNTAVSIAQAVNQQTAFVGFTASTTSANVVTITCPTTGTNCGGDLITVHTSSLTTSGTFSGGNGNAVLTVNGVPLTQGNQWTANSSASTTALSLANAINASSSLSAIIVSTAPAGSSVIYATSTATGSGTNYAWSSSNTGSMTLSNSGLFGGTKSAYQINSGTINIPNHGLSTGYGVVFSTPSGTGITPLVNGTTYYVIVVDANDIELATSLANATAGTFITLTSLSTSGPHTFTLTPQAYSGTASMAWYGSVDCIAGDYNPINVSSLTITAPTTASQATLWDFGRINYTCLQLQVIAPTQGGLKLAVKVNGKN